MPEFHKLVRIELSSLLIDNLSTGQANKFLFSYQKVLMRGNAVMLVFNHS